MIAEFAADTGELQRSFEEGFAHGFTLLVPVFVAVVALVVADGIKSVSAAGVFREVDAQDVDDLVFADALLVECTETVALMQTEEVHGPGIDICQFKD